jgi:hypothetical protein
MNTPLRCLGKITSIGLACLATNWAAETANATYSDYAAHYVPPSLISPTLITSLPDLSVNQLNLTLAGVGVCTNDANGITFQYNQTAYLRSATTAILDNDTNTIAFRIRFNGGGAGNWGKIFGYDPSGSTRSPGIWQNKNATSIFWPYDPNDTPVLVNGGPTGENSSFAIGQWYSIVGVKIGGTFNYYVNGNACWTSSVPNPKYAGTAPIEIGAGNTQDPTATIQEVSVWTRALAPAEAIAWTTNQAEYALLPIISLPAGTYDSATNVTINSPGATTLYYQIGTNPWQSTNSSKISFTLADLNGGSENIQAYATAPSNVGTYTTATNTGGPYIFTNNTSTAQPLITLQPGGESVFVGDTATLSVAATGTPPLTYQWSFNGTNLANATNDILILTNVQFAEAGDYSVLITNLYGSNDSGFAVLTVEALPACNPAPAGIVAWWPGSGNAWDVIGGNTGTLLGGLGFAPGEVGQAFDFTSTNGYVFVPASPRLNVGTNGGFTVEAWIKPADVTSQMPLFGWGTNSATLVPWLWTAVGTPGCLYANVLDATNVSHILSSAGGLLQSNVYQHVAWTYSTNTGFATLYLDGEAVASASLGSFVPNTTGDVYLGKRVDGVPTDIYSGGMDEVTLYDRALSQAEIEAIYQASAAGKCQTLLTPVIYVQPTNQQVTANGTATLAVAAGGTPPLAYQWQLNGINVPAGTNSTLTLTNVWLGQAGVYDVTVANAAGSVTSTPTVLAVQFLVVDVNGLPDTNTLTAASPAALTIQGGYPGGYLFYTLDGTLPTVNSTVYAGAIPLTNSATVSVLSLSADFTQSSNVPPVLVQIIPNYDLQTSTVGNGTLSTNPPVGPYASNSVVILTATAAQYWEFAYWTGDASGNQNPLSLTMNGPRSVQAVFVQNAFPFTLGTPGGGMVTANGQAIGGATYYTNGSVVSLVAMPSNGWSFLGWQGSVGGTNNPLNLTVNQANNIQAIFGTLVGTSATGGSILLNASNPVPYGTLLTVSAQPNPGNYFVEWMGNASGATTPIQVTVQDATPSYGALFAPLPAGEYSLSVVVSGGGYTTANPQASYYSPGSTVTLTAVTNSGNYFFGWTQGASGAVNPLTVVISSNTVIQASFGLGSTVSITPQSQSVLAGSNAVLTASAVGLPPLAYQWFAGQEILDQATNVVYTIYDTQPTNAGSYWVVVSNSLGSVTSAVATVTVIGAPWITNQPAPVTVTVGHAASFMVAASGWPPPAYQWQLNGASVTAGTNDVLTLSNAFPINAGVYSVAITNVYGSVTSNPVLLTVSPLGLVIPSGLVDGQLQFSFDTAAGVNYEVQYSTNLTDWYPWLNASGNGQSFKLSDPNTDGSPQRFYRVLLTPP